LVERNDWNGLVRNRLSAAEIRLVAPLGQGGKGDSGAFIGLADDENRYWVKPLNNLQDERILITEQVVARAGSLIDAPTCEVRTIDISSDFKGWEFRPGFALEAGVAHASKHVDGVVETRQLSNRHDDDNAARHTAIFALYDWCWGNDPQWLQQLTSENRFFSHDHGWYLPPLGPGWGIDTLTSSVDLAHELLGDRKGISLLHADPVARQLEKVSRDQIAEILLKIPTSWRVTDEELETLGFFLERRAPAAASRLRHKVGGAP